MNNPYQSPDSDIRKSSSSQQANPSPFSRDGRLTRLSYLAWSTIIGFAAQAIITVILFALDASFSPIGIGMVNPLVMIPSLFFQFIFTMRRTHDIGKGGWWVALYMLPLINFYIWFKCGDAGDNEFGAPRPTTTSETIIAYLMLAFIALAVVGGIIIGVVGGTNIYSR